MYMCYYSILGVFITVFLACGVTPRMRTLSAITGGRLYSVHVLLQYSGCFYYSILGVRCDASDEDIKRYYRRQAV